LSKVIRAGCLTRIWWLQLTLLKAGMFIFLLIWISNVFSEVLVVLIAM
jgi:hypothetical protein